jgi:transposase
MQGRKEYNPKLMYQLHLDNLVPKDNYYRQLDQVLDLEFLYKATAEYYGDEGQESIDPVVFIKICLVGYLNNINSDRRLIEYCGNCLDVRLFIRYDLDETLPWHSTISRTRQLYGEEVFLALFRKVLSMCAHKGMVRGKRQAIDSAFIKANASMDSLVEKEVVEDAGLYLDELDEGSEYRVSKTKKAIVDKHHAWKVKAYKGQPSNQNTKQLNDFGEPIRPRYLSNHTHYSPTDPDARISVKVGKARQLNYYGQIAVDDAHHVITGAMADHADQKDSQCLPAILDQTIENLNENEIRIEQIAADTGYSSGEALRYCEENAVEAYIPNFGLYKPTREGFIYNKDLDLYECTRGNKAILPFRRIFTDKKGYQKRVYRSDNSKCKNCPLRSSCIGKSDFKKLDDSIDKPYYDRMHQRMQTQYARKISKIRSSTVEPVLGTLINFLNMKRVNTKGINQANKHVLMAALCYNLKKYMKFNSTKLISIAKSKEMNKNTGFVNLFKAISDLISRFLRNVMLMEASYCYKNDRQRLHPDELCCIPG